jgi:hypothetical protein
MLQILHEERYPHTSEEPVCQLLCHSLRIVK